MCVAEGSAVVADSSSSRASSAPVSDTHTQLAAQVQQSKSSETSNTLPKRLATGPLERLGCATRLNSFKGFSGRGKHRRVALH